MYSSAAVVPGLVDAACRTFGTTNNRNFRKGGKTAESRMKEKLKRMDVDVRKLRDCAGNLNFGITTPRTSRRAFDAIAYAAVLEVIG
jgi:hypothetical protein